MGTEKRLFYSDPDLSAQIFTACDPLRWRLSGSRRKRSRTDLYFLSQTSAEAILVETVFVDSSRRRRNLSTGNSI